MGAGILPIALYRGTIFLLLGQERSNNLWSDFGGSSHKGERPFKTAIREGAEELNGFLGDEEELEEEVKKNMVIKISYDKYTTYVYRTKYNSDLPKYFINNNKFIESKVQNIIKNNYNGLYEKKSIEWFSLNKFKDKKTKLQLLEQIRPHYKEHINSIVKNNNLIINELEKLETN